MFINNYCTDFMFQKAMMCETCSPSILSLIIFNEQQIISGCPIDGAISVRGDSRFGSYRWFVYITTLLLRDASWILILDCGTPERAQRHLYC